MNDKRRRFADEYLIDLDVARAYMVAYPNIKKHETARKLGGRLMSIDAVRTYIDERLEVIQNQKTADAREVMEYLTSVMRGESKAEVVVVEGTGDGCSSACGFMKTPDEKEKLKAAELLGKRHGIFTEKLKVDAAIPVVITGGGNLED